METQSLKDCFMSHIEKDAATECWIWMAGASNGRGYFSSNHGIKSAYRMAYELLVGPIPKGYVIHHRCHNPLCVNPDHLETMIPGEHTRMHLQKEHEQAPLLPRPRAQRTPRTHCPHGHALTDDNLVPSALADGLRACRECKNIRARAYQRRRYAALKPRR